MSSGRRVMAELDNVATELFIVRDIEFSLVVNKSVLLFPFKKTIKESTRSFGFERLESLSHREFAIQTVLDALFRRWHRNFSRAKIECCSSKSMEVLEGQDDLVIVFFSIRNLVV
jgi:hypothetical protein